MGVIADWIDRDIAKRPKPAEAKPAERKSGYGSRVEQIFATGVVKGDSRRDQSGRFQKSRPR